MTRFMQKFYGQDFTSWKGKYSYCRHGFIESIPHRILRRGVVIFRSEDLEKVLNFLKDYSLNIYVIEVKLTPDDEKFL